MDVYIIKNGTNSKTGANTWVSFNVSFGVTYRNIPLISVMPASQFADENIVISGFTGNTNSGYTGFTYQVYCDDSSFNFVTRLFAIGVAK